MSRNKCSVNDNGDHKFRPIDPVAMFCKILRCECGATISGENAETLKLNRALREIERLKENQ